MLGQVSLFDGSQKFKINKPIRLIELFGGYGSQHFALEYLGVNFEQWKLCEWAVKSIQAYKDAHFQDDNNDYSKGLTKEQVFDYLTNKGISANYNEPMTFEQVKRLGEEKARTIYNNIQATHNLVNIQQAKGKDFEIVDTDKYCYMMTYSFPCQDLSSAGLGKGMEKGSGTRSGMLWEVERILEELKQENRELPQILVMENVPEVIGTNNIKHFAKWLEKLEEFGYKNKWQVLNAKDFSVPQNRERCFMVSMLGDYWYEFPEPKKLELRLKELLEENVDEKYYLSDKMVTFFKQNSMKNELKHNGFRFSPIEKESANISKCITTRSGGRMDDNFIKDNNCIQVGQLDGKFESTGRIYGINGISPTVTTCSGGNREPKILDTENLKTKMCNELIASGRVKENDVIRHSYSTSRINGEKKDIQANNKCPTLDTRCDCLGVVNDYRIRKLTPKECFRLMGVKDKDFEKIAQNQSNASLYHLAGDSIVVDVLMAIFKEML